MASAEIAAVQPVREDLDGPYKQYNLDMKVRLTAKARATPTRDGVSSRARRASVRMNALRCAARAKQRARALRTRAAAATACAR
jgi:hypothetical protein